MSGYEFHGDPASIAGRLVRMLSGLKQVPLHLPQTPQPLPQGEAALMQAPRLWLGAQAVAIHLEERHPEPSIFPNGNRGMPMLLFAWWAGFAEKAQALLEGDADMLGAIQIEASYIDRQLVDGRDFLQGQDAALVDFLGGSVLSLLREALGPRVLDGAACLPEWLDRCEGLMAPVAGQLQGKQEILPEASGPHVSLERAEMSLSGHLTSETGELYALHTGQQLIYLPKMGTLVRKD